MWAGCRPAGSVALALWGSLPSPASSIVLSPKPFLLAGRPFRHWHRDCVSCWE
jgi:hypothetical protein